MSKKPTKQKVAKMKPQYEHILFDMKPGSLVVYSLITDNHTPISNFYWRDAASPQGFGPFVSLKECMSHYSATVQSFRTPTPLVQPKDNVIYVDFVSKKRL
jgi:hypothetical protein